MQAMFWEDLNATRGEQSWKVLEESFGAVNTFYLNKILSHLSINLYFINLFYE